MGKGRIQGISGRTLIVMGVVFVASLVTVGLMAGLINRPNCAAETTTQPPVETTTTPLPVTTEEPGPWQDPFLPGDSIVPVTYDIWLYPDFYHDGSTFQGKEDIVIAVKKDTKYLIVHYKMMNITKTEVKKNGQILQVSRAFAYDKNQFWVVELKDTISEGEEVILHLEFEGSLVNGIVGYYKSTYFNSLTNKTSWLATSKFQPTDARKAFPNFDEPQYKANFTITLRHWQNFTALSNMPVANETDYADGWRETRFEKSPLMSSYLVCFIVCDFEYTENRMANGIVHRVWSSPDKINQTLYASKVGKIIFDYFEDELNMTFHLPKLDQIAIPDYPSGATEHWGLVTYRLTSLLYDEETVSVSGKQRVAQVVSHELTHHYFGNAVTCKWWDDIWLNEGFANFYEDKGLEVAEPTWKIHEQFITAVLQNVMKTDGGQSSRPVRVELTDPDQINSAFDGITYNKGASMLRMIEGFMGKDSFRTAIRNYLKKHEYSTVVAQDLYNALQEEAEPGLNITVIMKPWIEQMGLPVLTIQTSGSNLEITQKRFLVNPEAPPNEPESPYNYEWSIPVTYFTESGQNNSMWLSDKEVTIPNPATGNEWYKFNNEQLGYYRVNYPESHWENFKTLLISNYMAFDTVDRTNLLDDAFQLADATQLNFSFALDLSQYLKNEDQYVPWTAASRSLSSIGRLLSDSSDYGKWQKYMVQITTAIMDRLQVKDEGTHLERLLRSTVISLACGNGHVTCLQNITVEFQKWLDNEQLNPVSPSLRSLVYSYGMQQTGGDEEWDEVWTRYTEATTDQEKGYLLRALAQTNKIWLIQKYLVYASDPTKIKDQDFFSAISYISGNPNAIQIVWDWVRSNYDALIERFTISNRSFGRMVPNMVSGFKTSFHLEEVEAFFAKYPDAGTGTLPRQQALAQIKSNIEWLQNNEKVILDWVKNNV